MQKFCWIWSAMVGCGAAAGGAANDPGDGQVALDEGIPDAPPPPCRDLVSERESIPLVAEEVTSFVLAGVELTDILQSSVNQGDYMPGIELLSLDDATGVSDDALGAGVFELAQDVDGDTSDNSSGKEPLCLRSEGLDAKDEPLVTIDCTLEDGHLQGGRDAVVFPSITVMGIPTPEVTIHDYLLTAEVEADVAGLSSSHQEGAVWVNELASLTISGLPLLPIIACGFPQLMLPATAPDRDVDGDGLETITCGNDSIVSCGDFDDEGNAVVIEDPGCGAELEDGYSFVLDFQAVRYVLDGVTNN